jgi:uncharacterized protein YndB with AHSA1/START domain
MYRYSKQVTIDAPRQIVWEAIADIGAISRFSPTITESYVIGEASGGIGARRFCRHKLMGGIEEVVVAWEEGRMQKLAVTDGVPPPARDVAGTYELTDTSDGQTELRLSIEFDLGWGPLGRVMRPMMAAILKRDLALGLAGLKHLVELGEPVPTRRRRLPVDAVAA